MITSLVVIIVGAFLLPLNAFAYLDAGSGSIILQALVGGTLAGIFLLKSYWTRLKQFIGKLFGADIDDGEQQSRP